MDTDSSHTPHVLSNIQLAEGVTLHSSSKDTFSGVERHHLIYTSIYIIIIIAKIIKLQPFNLYLININYKLPLYLSHYIGNFTKLLYIKYILFIRIILYQCNYTGNYIVI